MRHRFAQLTFTPSVRRAQHRYGGRTPAEPATAAAEAPRLGERETAFIAARDSFYLATVSETGWPYVQHRGGPPGFLQVLGPATVGFADFAGNRQYLSVGNLAHDNRVSLILVDYPARRRLKLLGRARVVDAADAPSAPALPLAGYPATAERLILIEVEAYDWNCSQHITPRFSAAQMAAATRPLEARIAALEALLAHHGIPMPPVRPAPPSTQEATQ